MNIFKRYNIKQVLLTVMWLAIGTGSIALLVAAVHAKDIKACKGLDITIHGVSNNFFIDEADVKKIIRSYTGNIEGAKINEFKLLAMEAELKREVWIKNADLYFDNNAVLKVTVEEREPIARVFSSSGSSFYIDNEIMMLPLSEKLSARLPVFTGFPSENKVLSKKDSSLLRDVRNLSMLIQQDSFLMAMIEQVDITASRTFEMIPKLGDQTIAFGDASNAEQKFKKLQLFYRKVMQQYGWNRYSIINLQYKGQVVAKLKGKDDVSADSLRTQEIMRAMAMNAAMAANDSLQMMLQDNERNTTSVSMIERSIERDDDEVIINPFPKYLEEAAKKAAEMPEEKAAPIVRKPAAKPVMKPLNKPVTKVPVKRPVKAAVKQTVKQSAAVKQTVQPKAVMQKKNDY